MIGQTISHYVDAEDGVIGETDLMGFTPESGLHHLLEPFVEHVVQVDVGQERTDRLSLPRPLVTHEKLSLVDDSHLNPLPYLSRVKMNAPYGTPLTAPHVTTGGYADGKQLTKEGRHVGLDFYDLLIEGLYTHTPSRTKPRAALDTVGSPNHHVDVFR